MNAPLPYIWSDGAWRPHGNWATAQAHDRYGEGQSALLDEVEERSEISHRHEFVWLRDCWLTLPESIAANYPSPEHLRKKALIAKGWCHVRDYPMASRREAVRLAAALDAETDEYTVVLVEDAVVRVCRAKSQAKNKMKAADFQKSKSDIMDYVAALLGIETDPLQHARAA